MAPMEKSGAARTGVVLIAVAANLLDHRGVRRRFANCRPVYRRRRDRGYAEKSDCSRQQHRQNHNTHFLFLSCRATDAASVNTVDWLVRRYAATLSATPQHSQLDFGQYLNGLAIDRGAKCRVHQFFYGHGKAETARKIAAVSVYPANTLSRALCKLAKVELR
jgi:hypothetical protein